MINILKFDFFKIRKSLTIKLILLFSFILCFVNPLITYIIQSTKMSVLEHLTGTGSGLEICVMIFAIFFVGMDFSSKCIKNIYANSNKTLYVLSKIIYIFVFTLILILVNFLIDLIFNAIKFGLIIYKKQTYRTLEDCIVDYILRGGLMFGVGLVSMTVEIIIKNRAITLAVIFVYFFLASTYFYMLIDEVINVFHKSGFTIKPFTIFGGLSMYDYSLSPLRYSLDILCYSIVAFIISLMAYWKRKV